jgi:hypothetical protein
MTIITNKIVRANEIDDDEEVTDDILFLLYNVQLFVDLRYFDNRQDRY